MAKAIPTLGLTGWSKEISASADYILATYLTTMHFDSVLHIEQNTSMQYTLKEFAGNILSIEENMANDLQTKLQTVFGDTATATVDIAAEDTNRPDDYTIRFTGTVYSNDVAYTVGRLVYLENGKVMKIAELNNG